ncbi:MAG: nucleoside:proton symporter [Oceanicaulis sp.]|jgi:CNT family concentrative nucleoside transporter|uniref:NupC/NupG family nucleoside CNT transporter n=1 Tax=unclassified Oceanicaulis TaxID=2632123 RepID=UPI000066AB4C|nr:MULTISPECIES: nucleoside transporter C-terminal domain-containing protein [unclassified Oceanicaulis]EAP88849.1 putative H+/nucleoside symporter [Oceanicaulis alexandrii HTCC2633] [Oceanicaulis sp. HTCC2633]MAB68855.1 nucleoside:proton symporter [Oceanicaulis sp.]MBC39315.1 nucleoside:proton symporter [Oceanicaulis sp.]MBG35200.1 nucleoside:proton symporter [Oceanicaulis sp.]
MIEDLGLQLRSLIGVFVFLAIAWALGPRKAPPLVLVLGGVAVQFAIAIMLFSFSPTRAFLSSLTTVVEVLQAATTQGTSFVFGYLGGGENPYVIREGAEGLTFTFAFQALPMVIVLSAISAVLWRWRILEFAVRGFASLFRRILNLSGAASLGAAANIFLGMTESPVLIRPRLPAISRSDLFLIMTVGFSTVAGSVMAIYVSQLNAVLDDAAGHILTASLISVPAAAILARLMHPQDETAEQAEKENIPVQLYHSTMDALTTGVADGVKLFVNIIAMLLVFTAIVALVNFMLGGLPDFLGEPITVQRMLGYLFSPLVWIAGLPWSEAQAGGTVMGFKTALNEIFAYDALAANADALSPRSRLILTYAACGFANFSSVGILVGGLIAVAPSRREDILQLAPRALISGTLATLMTGAVIGTLPMSLFN